MTRWNYLKSIVALIVFTSGSMSAQQAGDYRTAATGNWETASVWETYSGSAWAAATTAPDAGAGEVTIQNGHTVTITADRSIDSVQVLGGGSVVINAGATVTVPANGGMKGIDVDTLGTVVVNGTLVCEGSVGGAALSFIFNDGGVYEHARNEGSVPRSDWKTGSTVKLTGVTANSPSNMSQDFYNVVIDCPGIVANLNMGMSGNTIHGDITVLQTGASNRYYLTAPDAFEDPITTLGNIYVHGGVFSSNGSSTLDHIIVHSYGNIIVTAGNFGCSRGSGTSVSWYFYGDTMKVHDATLQNSTSSPDRIQKFIFSKQGTQVLDFSNVGYGSSGLSSPITLQVSAGATLDIGTSHLPNYSTGSFILDSGAVLAATHNGPGNEGNIEYLADLGGGNSFVNIKAAAGTGRTTVKAFKGAHPNSHDTSKALHRYWDVTAEPGITEGTMTFYYYDLDPAGSEVRGTETAYKALRYDGTGTGWTTEAGSTVDDFFDYVTATGVTTLSGTWTVGEAVPVGVFDVTAEESIPEEFFVSQNFPNPFNPATSITFGIPADEHVTAAVYDLLGRHVMTLASGHHPAGTYTLRVDASHFPSGTYVYRVQAGAQHIVKRMTLLK